MSVMIEVHHLNNSRSQRVLWLLEELGGEYQIVKYERDPETLLAPPELRRIHPLGKSPVIRDDGHTIAESGAIIEYLVDRYGDGRLSPLRSTEAYLRYRYWMHYAEGSAMPPLLLKLVFTRMPKAGVPGVLRPLVRAIAQRAQRTFIDPQVATHLRYWDDELGAHEWFAGAEFTAADIQMSFPAEAAASRAGIELGSNVKRFLERIHARPAYQRALQVGGAYQLY